jgi:hypothetical protein
MPIFLISALCFLSAYASPADCGNLWVRPASQNMSMDSSISFALTDFKNGERHFSVKQDPEHSADIYYLNGAVLVKGYSQAQIEQFPENALFMMPMTFAVPIAVLSETVPKGPCTIEAKVSISVPLSGAMRLQDRKLTKAVGEVFPSAPSEISYQLDVSIDPPAPNKTAVRYSGAMSFASQQESPPDETDVSGYLVVTRTRPFPSAGSSGVPGKLGELRRFLAAGKAAPNPAVNTDAAR